MRYTYAALLLDETGAEIDERTLTDVLEAAGAEPNVSRVKAIVAALKGVDVGDVAPAGADDALVDAAADEVDPPVDDAETTGPAATGNDQADPAAVSDGVTFPHVVADERSESAARRGAKLTDGADDPNDEGRLPGEGTEPRTDGDELAGGQ